MFAHFDGDRAAPRDEKAQAAAFTQAEGRGLQFVADFMAVEAEVECRSARLQPFEMQFEQPDTVDRIESHGFEQVEPSVSQ